MYIKSSTIHGDFTSHQHLKNALNFVKRFKLLFELQIKRIYNMLLKTQKRSKSPRASLPLIFIKTPIWKLPILGNPRG